MGYASGYLIKWLKDSKYCRCTGIEPNEIAATDARAGGFTIHNIDALSAFQTMPPTVHVDHIIVGDVLEHIVDPLSVLEACRSLLAP